VNITEQQRLAAIASCDRIEKLNAKMQTHMENILVILKNAANGGVEKLAQCYCCDRMFPRDSMANTTTSCGLETFACEECRGAA
jgi:hypothetical protein